MQSLLKELGSTLITFQQGKDGEKPHIDFELAEELMARLVWCKQPAADTVDGNSPANVAEVQLDSALSGDTDDQQVEIDWPTGLSSELVTLPFTQFSKPVEKVFLTPETDSHLLDDHEHSLPTLIYKTLLALPADARAICMSRIIFVGGGSKIPGLAQRSIADVGALVKRHGWSAVRGKKAEERREKLGSIRQGRTGKPSARYREPLPAEKDYIEEKLQKQQAKEALPIVQGELRQIESLGAWAGASLLTSMKVKGFVEIERDKFLQQGLAGAHRNVEVSAVPQRTSYGAGLSKAVGERTSWTLAGWA